MKKFLEIIKNKWLIKGTTTVALVAIVIACYILLNWGVEKINLEDLDCTEKKLYSLSSETKNKIANLDKEVTIQLINMNDSNYVIEYSKKYAKISDKIKIDEVSDLSSRVDLMTKYDLESSDSLIVVKSGDKEKTLTLYDLYTYDYSTYEQIDITEEAITNAIVEVTLEEKPHIYILSGKAYYATEQALSSIITKLKDESNEVDYVDILTTGEVPSDCDCLIITTLEKDLTELERDKIIEYIQRGGKIMMLTSQNIIDVGTPNFDAVLAQYGITLEFGAVFEQDSSKMLQNAPEMAIVEAKASFMSKLDMSVKMCMLDAGKIQFADSDKLEELGVEYETIATTGEKSFVRTNFDIKSYTRTEQDGEEGEAIVGALATKKISDDVNSELIIYSNEIFASDMQVAIGSQYYTYAVELYNNKDVILNSISHLTERTDTITIRKTGESEKYTVTDQQDAIIKTIIFVLPVIIIGIGIVVWQVRRRKK